MKWIEAAIAAIIALAVVAAPQPARAQIKMSIVGPGSQLWAVALPGLKNLAGDDEHRLSAGFIATLRRDLELSGYFRTVDPRAYIEDSEKSGYDLGQFNFADWSSINAEFLVKGGVSVSGSTVKLTAMLYDVAQRRRLMGKVFTVEAADVPRMARRFADAVLQATTGQRGPFDSKLAFASTRGGRFKEIYTQSIEGQELFRLTDNPTINIFPSFDRSAREILYLSYKTREPGLYLAQPDRRQETRLFSRLGRLIGGSIAPDGQSIAAAIERDGGTNLYLLDRDGHELRQLTDTTGINVSSAFSPDGNLLAFTSDRSGTPQIWVMPVAGGSPRRMTYTGSYNTTPSFSPGGDQIAYQGRANGRFDIYMIPTAGGEPRELTDAIGSNESPTWSPDGRYIAFSSTREGNPRIFLLIVQTGKIIGALTEGNGDDTSPAWSWWLGE